MLCCQVHQGEKEGSKNPLFCFITHPFNIPPATIVIFTKGVYSAFSSEVILIPLKARGRKEKERGRREVAMLKSLDSDFVIRLVDAYEGRSEVILVTEYLAGGELFERVVDEDFDLTESHCVLFVRQICQGVARHSNRLSKFSPGGVPARPSHCPHGHQAGEHNVHGTGGNDGQDC